MTSHLQAPWRMQYIRSLSKPDSDECFICAAAKATSEEELHGRLVVSSSEHTVTIINLFPYTNGHLLVAPKRHLADLELLSADESADLMRQTTEAVKLLKTALSPQGFNIGINLGKIAGAGLPGHVH